MTAVPVVRVAGADDVEAIVRVVNDAFEVESFFKNAPRTTAADVRALMQSGEFLVVDGDPGTLAGAVYVSPHGERGYLGMLSVAGDRQGQGLGRTLQNAGEARCAAAGCRELEIHVVDLRPELLPYYERLGFSHTGETRPFPVPQFATQPCHLLVMTKPLGGE